MTPAQIDGEMDTLKLLNAPLCPLLVTHELVGVREHVQPASFADYAPPLDLAGLTGEVGEEARSTPFEMRYFSPPSTSLARPARSRGGA